MASKNSNITIGIVLVILLLGGAAKARIASFSLEPLPVTPPAPPAHFRG